MDIGKALKDQCFGKNSQNIYGIAKFVDVRSFDSVVDGILECIERQKLLYEVKCSEFIQAEEVAENFCGLLGIDYYMYRNFFCDFKFDEMSSREIYHIRLSLFGSLEINYKEPDHSYDDFIYSYKEIYKDAVKDFKRGLISAREAMQQIYDFELNRILSESKFYGEFRDKIKDFNGKFPNNLRKYELICE